MIKFNLNKPRHYKKSNTQVYIFRGIYILVALCFCATGVWLALSLRDQAKGGEEYASLLSEIESAVNDNPNSDNPHSDNPNSDNPTSESSANSTADSIPATSAKVAVLQEQYPEAIGWLRQEALGLDYPIMQSEDNDKYLNALPTGEKNALGSIFLDYRADIDGRHILLYGHNAPSGKMFGSLKAYADKSYAAEHPSFLLNTTTEEFVCEIFSVQTVDEYDPLYVLDFTDAEYADFIKRLKAASSYPLPITPTINDRIITLSTCVDGRQTDRLVIHARIKEVPQ